MDYYKLDSWRPGPKQRQHHQSHSASNWSRSQHDSWRPSKPQRYPPSPEPTRSPPDQGSFERGMSLMLIGREACEYRGLPLPSFMHPGIFQTSHPCLVLEEFESEVRVVLMSSFRDADFPSKDPRTRKQHIPVWPTPAHPDYGDQLQLKTGRMHKVGSYVKAHETWMLPKAYFSFNMCKITGEQVEFAPESVDYVDSIAAEFDMYRRRDRIGVPVFPTAHRWFEPTHRILGFPYLGWSTSSSSSSQSLSHL